MARVPPECVPRVPAVLLRGLAGFRHGLPVRAVSLLRGLGLRDSLGLQRCCAASTFSG